MKWIFSLKNLSFLFAINFLFSINLCAEDPDGDQFVDEKTKKLMESLRRDSDDEEVTPKKKSLIDQITSVKGLGDDFDSIKFGIEGEYVRGVNEKENKYILYPTLSGRKNRWTFLFRYEFSYEDGLKSYQTRKDYLRIIQKLEYNGLPNTYFNAGHLREQTLGFGLLVENYRNDLQKYDWIPGAVGYRRFGFLELNALVSNIGKTEIIATRTQLDGTNYLTRPVLGIEYTTDYHAPYYVTDSDLHHRPKSESKSIIGKSIDLSFGFFKNTFRPFIQMGKLNGGKAVGFGVKYAKQSDDIKYETHLEGRKEQDKFIRHYFDEKYEAEKYDFHPDVGIENETKARHLDGLQEEWAYGALVREKITWHDVGTLYLGLENMKGHEKGAAFIDTTLYYKPFLEFKFKFSKDRIDTVKDFFETDHKSMFESGIVYTHEETKFSIHLLEHYVWNREYRTYEKNKEIVVGGGLEMEL